MGKSITLPETRLGSLAGDTLATLPELGRGVFVPEAPGHAGLCLGCWHRDTGLSLSVPRSPNSAPSENH